MQNFLIISSGSEGGKESVIFRQRDHLVPASWAEVCPAPPSCHSSPPGGSLLGTGGLWRRGRGRGMSQWD